MLSFSLRAPRRAFRFLNGFALLPALLTGSVALTAVPSLALRQDDKAADTAAKKDANVDVKSYTLQRKFKAGDVDRYQIDIDITGGQAVTLAMLLKNTTKEAKPAGGATIVGEFEKATASANGGDNEITGLLPTLTQTISPAGKMVDLKSEGGNPLLKQLGLEPLIKSVIDVAVYPPNAVKPGDTWEYQTDTTDTKQKAKGTATFVGPETINGIRTLKIKTVLDGDVSGSNPATGEKVSAKTHSEGTQNLDAATGRIVKVQTAVASKSSGGLGDFNIKFTMALVTGDAKDGAKKPDAKPQP